MSVDASVGRSEVLRRVRAALSDLPRENEAAIHAEWGSLPRAYLRSAAHSREQTLEMLEDRLRDYDATVVRVPSASVGEEMERALAARGLHRLIIPAGLAEAIGGALPEGFQFSTDSGFSPAELDGFQGVVTAATLAIAQTGTIVLQNVAGQGRRAPTLVPDYHLCLVRAGDVVETVPEAFDRLSGTATLATTFISGPSATADIEMTRIKGVHGPRTLDVIVIET